MSFRITSLTAALAVMLYSSAFAQDLPCGAASVNNEQLANPAKAAIATELDREAAEYTEAEYGHQRGVVRVIPIVFHIIHNNGPENISKEQVLDAVRIINEDFRGENPDLSMIVDAFSGITADSEIEFRLAKKDPNGNCTDGITRTVSSMTFDAGENVKGLISWNTARYLNVWVVQNIASGAGGYAYYPGNAPSQSQEGIVVRNSQLGSIGTSGGSNFASRTLTHEIGHYLNLRHVWGNSNENADPGNCNEDDNVNDTPNTIGSEQTCNLNQNSCGSLDNVQNYMDYSTCARMFTEGQKSRMQAALQSSAGQRNNLWTSTNLVNTGTNDGFEAPCTPQVAFFTSNTMGCEGLEVTFNELTWGADEDDSWEWNWSFPGGTPSSSNERNPVVTYSTPGVYNASLTVTTDAGSNVYTENNLVTVNELGSGDPAPFSESMEASSWPNESDNEWIIEAGSGTTWQRTTAASSDGSACARINLRVVDSGVLNSFISPPFDMSNVSSSDARLRFKVAHATRNSSGHTERLRVYASTDCGETWQIRYTRSGAQLSTASGTVTGSFVPNSTQWREEDVSLAATAGSPHVLLKFEAMSDGQNYLYVDDINVASGLIGSTGLMDQPLSDVSIFPNPIDQRSVLSISSATGDDAIVRVTDALGRTLAERSVALSAGSNSIALEHLADLSVSGIYFVSVNMGSQNVTLKLVK